MSCADELCAPPDVCANAEQSKEQHLISHSTNENDSRLKQELKRDKPLLLAIVAIVVFLNVPFLRYILYPFMIFSTWVHEMCHGMAAILTGGGIKELFIYKDGSGLAYTYSDGSTWKRAVIASAGYTGTALLGGVLLLFRRTRRGPTIGTIGVGLAILLSCALYVRNAWGATMLSIGGIVIVICGWKVKAKGVAYLYSFLAATCSFNAVTSIKDLFADQGYVNGEPMSSDAHTVAELWGMTNIFWATWWMIFALIMSFIGLVFVFDGLTYKEGQQNGQGQATQDYYTTKGQTNQSYYSASEQGGLPVSVF